MKYDRANFVASLAMLLCGTGLTGCASGPTHPPIEDRLTPAFVGIPGPQLGGKQLVVLRFPYAFSEADAPELRRRFNSGAYFGLGRFASEREPDEKTFDGAVAKTSYYALLLQEALQSRLPDASVILQPVFMQVKDKSVVSFAGDFESIVPSVVIDFFAYVRPQWKPDIVQPFATVGRTLVPIVTVRTLPQVSTQTSGSAAGMAFLAGLTQPGSGAGAYGGAGASIADLMNCGGDDAFLVKSSVLAPTTHITQRPWQPNHHLVWPTLKLTLDSAVVKGTANELQGNQAVDALAYVVRDVMRAVENHPVAQRELASLSAQNYDLTAASSIRAGRPITQQQENLLKAFAGAEQVFLERQSLALHDRLLSGEWPVSFRESRAKEQSSLTKAKAVGWLSILAAGAMGSPVATMALSDSLEGSYTNWASSMTTSLVEVRAEQLNVSFNELGSESEITAHSMLELRTKLREIYAKTTKAPSKSAR